MYFRTSLGRELAYLVPFAKNVHGVVIDAHILELYSNAVGSFLFTSKLNYFLDPVFYKFCKPFFQDVSGKRWVEPLSKAYGFDIGSLGAEGFTQSGLQEKGRTASVARGVLNYQRTRMPSTSPKMLELAALLDDRLDGIRLPEFLVSPYIIIENSETLEINTKLLKDSISALNPGEKLYAVLAITRDYLQDQTRRSELLSVYSPSKVAGFLIWMIDFKEWFEDKDLFTQLSEFIAELKSRSRGKEVINLFGGFYSSQLCGRGAIDGSVQGIGISESRDPYYVGGGGVPRYYVPISHQSVGLELADDLRANDSSLFSCNCNFCKGFSSVRRMTAEALAKHFVSRRLDEFDESIKKPASQLFGGLRADAVRVRAVRGTVSPTTSAHSKRLEVWSSALETEVNAGRLT